MLAKIASQLFAALVLLFTLVNAREKHRVFLIEDPQAMLSPPLQLRFLEILLATAKQFSIQLIVTTNSEAELSLFEGALSL